jgi:hypothetical protein
MKQHWFIGYDPTEDAAYEVAKYSLARHATCDLRITPIKQRAMRKAGLFYREWRMDGSGQWWDIEDGRPFSTEFAFTRFLAPTLARRAGVIDWAFFCDCDFLFRADVLDLALELDASKALMCVQHDFRPVEARKMDGQLQVPYRRKNWSSLMAFNLRHPANERLTMECVNTMPGSWLHGMEWLKDEEIGALDPAWNTLVGHPGHNGSGKALHYTDGGPWIDDRPWCDSDQPWLDEYYLMQHPTPTTHERLMKALA